MKEKLVLNYTDKRSTRIGCYPFVIEAGQVLVFNNMRVPYTAYAQKDAFYVTTWIKGSLLSSDNFYQMLVYKIQEDNDIVYITKSIDNGKTFKPYNQFGTGVKISLTLNPKAELEAATF